MAGMKLICWLFGHRWVAARVWCWDMLRCQRCGRIHPTDFLPRAVKGETMRIKLPQPWVTRDR
jgi:hypothetical protein